MTHYHTCPACGHTFPDYHNRFWEKVDKRGDDECWPWMGRTIANGYGTFERNGQAKIATRVMWELTYGKELPREVFVCHKCDNPNCVNPAHFFPGTAKDNAKDKILKGRGAKSKGIDKKKGKHFWVAKGQSNGAAKLTEIQVRQIRERYKTGEVLQTELAKEYGVTPQCIHLVVHRITFADLSD